MAIEGKSGYIKFLLSLSNSLEEPSDFFQQCHLPEPKSIFERVRCWVFWVACGVCVYLDGKAQESSRSTSLGC